jgi:hypothetical protein
MGKSAMAAWSDGAGSPKRLCLVSVMLASAAAAWRRFRNACSLPMSLAPGRLSSGGPRTGAVTQIRPPLAPWHATFAGLTQPAMLSGHWCSPRGFQVLSSSRLLGVLQQKLRQQGDRPSCRTSRKPDHRSKRISPAGRASRAGCTFSEIDEHEAGLIAMAVALEAAFRARGAQAAPPAGARTLWTAVARREALRG